METLFYLSEEKHEFICVKENVLCMLPWTIQFSTWELFLPAGENHPLLILLLVCSLVHNELNLTSLSAFLMVRGRGARFPEIRLIVCLGLDREDTIEMSKFI